MNSHTYKNHRPRNFLLKSLDNVLEIIFPDLSWMEDVDEIGYALFSDGMWIPSAVVCKYTHTHTFRVWSSDLCRILTRECRVCVIQRNKLKRRIGWKKVKKRGAGVEVFPKITMMNGVARLIGIVLIAVDFDSFIPSPPPARLHCVTRLILRNLFDHFRSWHFFIQLCRQIIAFIIRRANPKKLSTRTVCCENAFIFPWNRHNFDQDWHCCCSCFGGTILNLLFTVQEHGMLSMHTIYRPRHSPILPSVSCSRLSKIILIQSFAAHFRRRCLSCLPSLPENILWSFCHFKEMDKSVKCLS